MIDSIKKSSFLFFSLIALAILFILSWIEVSPPRSFLPNNGYHRTSSLPSPFFNVSLLSSSAESETNANDMNSFTSSLVTPSTNTPLTVNGTKKLPYMVLKPIKPDCSTVHIAMVVTGDTGSIHLHTTIKSIFIHRSTALHFHFITDRMAKTVLQTMMNTWLLPSISHDYYDLTESWHNISSRKTNSQTNCSKTLSIHLNLDRVLPNSVQHVIVIEPLSVARIDLAKIWAVTVSRSDRVITVCQTECVQYCNDGGQKIELTHWGAVGVNLVLQRKLISNTATHVKCKPTSESIADKKYLFSHITKHSCVSVLSQDGEILRYNTVNRCPVGMKPLLSKPPKDVCKLFEFERGAKRRELPFLLGHRYISTGEGDVTLATHLDYNRLNLLKKVLSHWDGPASVAIHVTDSQVQNVVDFLLNSKSLRERRNVSYHLVFKVGPSYPPNHGRELAHRFVSTPYMFILDIDFVSCHGLYGILKKKLTSNEFGSMDKTAVVIPAFETDNINLKIPHKKSEMVNLFENGYVRQFRVKQFGTGHHATNYQKWKSTNELYDVTWENGYEPYYVIKTSTVTFDHRFIARFRDKVSHSITLHMAGYRFLVFPDSFMIHMPHKISPQNMDHLLKCDQSWYSDWLSSMKTKYHYI